MRLPDPSVPARPLRPAGGSPAVSGQGMTFRTEWRGLAVVTLLVLASCAALIVLNGRQWFWFDDFQSFYFPASHDIGRAWSSGEVPLLSPYSWFGGALA